MRLSIFISLYAFSFVDFIIFNTLTHLFQANYMLIHVVVFIKLLYCPLSLQMLLTPQDLSFVGYTYKNFAAVKGVHQSIGNFFAKV